MLKFLSKRKRSRKALLVFFVAVLAIGLVTFFGPGITDGLSGAPGGDTVVAEVGDYDITLKELRNALSNYGQQLAAGQGAIRMDNPSTIYRLYGPQVLDSLIRRKLVQYEAEQRNIAATDQEVQGRLKQMFNPWPGASEYQARLKQAGTTPVEFEDDLRAMISEEKLRNYVGAAVSIPAKEIEEEYRRTNTSYTVRWVEVVPDKFRDQVQLADRDLVAYFEQHKDEFRITSEQRRARYIFVDQNKAGEAIQVPDDELKQDFVAERDVRQVRVSQIVFNIPKEKPKADSKDAKETTAAPSQTGEEEVRKKAEELVSRAQGKEGKPAEDFAALARQYSDDAKSKAKGGDIGWVNKKDKRETDDPLNRVFTMQPGEVSQPTKKGDRFYILKVVDRKLPTFEEAREQLLKEARARKGYTKAVEIADEAKKRLDETKNVDQVVAELSAKHGAQAVLARVTPFFVEGDTLPDLGTATEFQTAVFELENIADVTERLNVTNGFAVAQYQEKRDPHDPTLEEVKSKVEERCRNEKAKEIAAERARQLARAKTPDELKSAADGMKAKVDERAGLSGADTIGPLISDSDRAPIYKLKVNEVTAEPIKVQDSDTWIVAALISRKDADMGEAFQKERKSIEERLMTSRREAIFSAYVARVQARLKEEGKIKIFQDVIEGGLEVEGVTGPSAPLPSGGTTRRRPRRTPSGPQQ